MTLADEDIAVRSEGHHHRLPEEPLSCRLIPVPPVALRTDGEEKLAFGTEFHHGGAVRGGDFYGDIGPNGSVFPVLQLNGPSDTDTRGRWIPTVSVEQYAATLATWYGVSPSDLPLVFPNIGRFSTANLGFMNV